MGSASGDTPPPTSGSGCSASSGGSSAIGPSPDSCEPAPRSGCGCSFRPSESPSDFPTTPCFAVLSPLLFASGDNVPTALGSVSVGPPGSVSPAPARSSEDGGTTSVSSGGCADAGLPEGGAPEEAGGSGSGGTSPSGPGSERSSSIGCLSRDSRGVDPLSGSGCSPKPSESPSDCPTAPCFAVLSPSIFASGIKVPTALDPVLLGSPGSISSAPASLPGGLAGGLPDDPVPGTLVAPGAGPFDSRPDRLEPRRRERERVRKPQNWLSRLPTLVNIREIGPGTTVRRRTGPQ